MFYLSIKAVDLGKAKENPKTSEEKIKNKENKIILNDDIEIKAELLDLNDDSKIEELAEKIADYILFIREKLDEADLFYSQGNGDECIRVCREVLKVDPYNVKAKAYIKFYKHILKTAIRLKPDKK